MRQNDENHSLKRTFNPAIKFHYPSSPVNVQAHKIGIEGLKGLKRLPIWRFWLLCHVLKNTALAQGRLIKCAILLKM